MPGTLTRWDAFADMAELRGRFDRVLEDFGTAPTREWTPALDIVVRDNGDLVVHADVPGDQARGPQCLRTRA
jgi:HSP20 family molecular chaperone IbpA